MLYCFHPSLHHYVETSLSTFLKPVIRLPTDLWSSLCLKVDVHVQNMELFSCPQLLTSGIELSVLCDSDPPLPVLQESVEVYWSSMEHHLRNYYHAFPRCMPFSLKFDPSILALCLVCVDKKKSLTCLSPSSPNQYRTTLTAGACKYVCFI